jgi:hypothetical protein
MHSAAFGPFLTILLLPMSRQAPAGGMRSMG